VDISGTLHIYSGDRRELFFVFDDEIAQVLYAMDEFEIDREATRRAFVSVGRDRFISERTLSFSKKQTEIKTSLCSKGSKEGLRSLTALYEWYVPEAAERPAPLRVLGELRRAEYQDRDVWELWIQEPTGVVVPPGLERRRRSPSRVRKTWERRRKIADRELAKVGRAAERVAFELLTDDYPPPRHECFWRDEYLDSERVEIRRLGIIADIDVWDHERDATAAIIEVKAQKSARADVQPTFYLSRAEWRTVEVCREHQLKYEVWLFQYSDVKHFETARGELRLIVFDDIREEWLDPDSYVVSAEIDAGTRYEIAD